MSKARPSKKARSKREIDLSLTPPGIGKCLFPDLPTELILLIISESSSDELDRHDTLFALSRTCRNLRNVTINMTWSVFEVVRSHHPGGGPYFATFLESFSDAWTRLVKGASGRPGAQEQRSCSINTPTSSCAVR